jgi:hypothetical protein
MTQGTTKVMKAEMKTVIPLKFKKGINLTVKHLLPMNLPL